MPDYSADHEAWLNSVSQRPVPPYFQRLNAEKAESIGRWDNPAFAAWSDYHLRKLIETGAFTPMFKEGGMVPISATYWDAEPFHAATERFHALFDKPWTRRQRVAGWAQARIYLARVWLARKIDPGSSWKSGYDDED